MNAQSDQLVLWVINVLTLTTVLTEVLLLIAMLLRTRAAMRYWILCCGLLLVLGSPAISGLIQSRGNSWLALVAPVGAAKTGTDATAASAIAGKQIPPNSGPLAASSPMVDSISESRSETVPSIEFPDRDFESDEGNLPAAASIIATEAIEKASSLLPWIGKGVVLAVLIWATGTAWLLLRMLVGWTRLARILKRADPIEDRGFQVAFTRARVSAGRLRWRRCLGNPAHPGFSCNVDRDSVV